MLGVVGKQRCARLNGALEYCGYPVEIHRFEFVFLGGLRMGRWQNHLPKNVIQLDSSVLCEH